MDGHDIDCRDHAIFGNGGVIIMEREYTLRQRLCGAPLTTRAFFEYMNEYRYMDRGEEKESMRLELLDMLNELIGKLREDLWKNLSLELRLLPQIADDLLYLGIVGEDEAGYPYTFDELRLAVDLKLARMDANRRI